MKTLIIAAILLAGCASNSGVVQMGKDAYMVARSDNSPAASLSSIKSAALRDASDHCAKTGDTYSVTGGYDVPRSLGQFPQTEVQFKCVAK